MSYHFTNMYQLLTSFDRYSHVDYAVANALSGVPPELWTTLTYDVACQYSINFVKRMKSYFAHLVNVASKIDAYVPSMHLLAHKENCQFRYALAYAEGVGRTHGETVEHPWSEGNQAGGSTQEMNAGHRHDTLDEFHGFWNWMKIQKMGKSSALDMPDESFKYTIR